MKRETETTTSIERLVEVWDGEQILCRHDAETGAWMFVCIHSTALGPAGGGTRLRVYDSPAAGLLDAMDLSEGMTRKMAIAGLPIGGGKGVIAVGEPPKDAVRVRVLEQYASLVNAMNGRFITGPDMNINMADLNTMGGVSQHVLGTEIGIIDGRTISYATALGTFHGIRASVREANGDASLEGLAVLVQGVGEVGAPLVDMLIEAGARVIISDVDQQRIDDIAQIHNVQVIAPEHVLGQPCDVYAPCAMGRVIGPEDVKHLRTRVIAGCANIQLRSPKATAEALHGAGITYGPDYVVNGGGAIHCFGGEVLGWTGEDILRRTYAIEDRLAEFFAVVSAAQIDAQTAADGVADKIVRLAAAAAAS